MNTRYSTKKPAFWLGIWVVFALIFGFVAARVFRSPYDRLVKNDRFTEGLITRMEAENHQNVYYSYIVGSATYSGVGHGGRAGIPRFELLQVGQKVPVYYDQDDPTISSLGDPAVHLRSANMLTVFTCLAFSTFATFAVWWKTRPST